MKPETLSFYQAAVTRAVQRIVETPDDALDLDALAKEAALSSYHFHRIFRGMLGETPLGMHRRLRLERAAARLLDTDEPVTTIAFEAGYETHESFTRAFRKAYGDPPLEFRKHATERPECSRPIGALPAASRVHFGKPLNTIHFLEEQHQMDVTIEELDPIRIATARHVGPYSGISQAFMRLGQLGGPAGLFGPTTMMLAIYHDDPDNKPPEELESFACASVSSDTKIPEGLGEATIPGGRYAKVTHVGPYSGLGDKWNAFMGQWLPKSGNRLGEGTVFEVYRNTPQTTPPAELCTDLYLPLA